MTWTDLIWFLVAISLPTLIGWFALASLFRGARPFALFEKIFLSFALGIGVVTWVQLLSSFAMIELRPFNIAAALLIAVVALAWPLRGVFAVERRIEEQNTEEHNSTRGLTLMLMTMTALGLLTTLVRTYYVEADLWDSWWMWAYKAKIIFYHGRLPVELFDELQRTPGHWDYPLHVPFMEAWVLSWLGYWNDQIPRLIIWMFYAGTCISIYAHCRRSTSKTYAWMGACFFATLSAPQLWTIGTITEPVLVYYYLASLLLLLRWFEERDQRFIILSGVMMGFAASTKNEGLALFATNLVCVGVFVFFQERSSLRRFAKPISLHVLAAAIVILPWIIFKAVAGMSNDVIRVDIFSLEFLAPRMARILELPGIFALHLSDTSRWNILWAVFLVSLLLHWRHALSERFRFLLLPLTVQLVGYSAMHVLWPYPDQAFVDDILPRLLLVPSTIAIVFVVLANAPLEVQASAHSASPALEGRRTSNLA